MVSYRHFRYYFFRYRYRIGDKYGVFGYFIILFPTF